VTQAGPESPRTEGDSALLIAIPEAEPVVGAMRVAHDAVAADGVPAHVTVLYPFVPRDQLTDEVRQAIASVIGGIPAFGYRFERVARFGDTNVHLAPEPASAFGRVTAAVHERWPEHPPYGGVIDVVVPHLTIGDGLDGPAAESLEAEASQALTHHGPIVGQATHVDLITWRAGAGWSVDGRFSLAPRA
jgi:hypothetical protein